MENIARKYEILANLYSALFTPRLDAARTCLEYAQYLRLPHTQPPVPPDAYIETPDHHYLDHEDEATHYSALYRAAKTTPSAPRQAPPATLLALALTNAAIARFFASLAPPGLPSTPDPWAERPYVGPLAPGFAGIRPFPGYPRGTLASGFAGIRPFPGYTEE